MAKTLIPQWTLGERLAKARHHAELEQAEMAAELGVSRVTVSNYEVGKTKPSTTKGSA